jgi:hypothetical protein
MDHQSNLKGFAMYRYRFRLAGLILSLLVMWGCVGREPITGQPVDGLDRKLSTFAWIEEGDLLTFIVDTRATRYRENEAYIPIEFAIANRGLRSLTLTAESFTLVDSDGKRYPAASPEELFENYRFLEFDRLQGMAELEGLLVDKFSAYTRYQSQFSPAPGSIRGTVHPTTHIPKFGYIIDLIYFPRPQTGIMGQEFELFVEAPQLEDPIFSRFMVE